MTSRPFALLYWIGDALFIAKAQGLVRLLEFVSSVLMCPFALEIDFLSHLGADPDARELYREFPVSSCVLGLTFLQIFATEVATFPVILTSTSLKAEISQGIDQRRIGF